MYSISIHIATRGIIQSKLSGEKYADFIEEYAIAINQIELEDSKTIQTTFT